MTGITFLSIPFLRLGEGPLPAPYSISLGSHSGPDEESMEARLDVLSARANADLNEASNSSPMSTASLSAMPAGIDFSPPWYQAAQPIYALPSAWAMSPLTMANGWPLDMS